MKRTIAMILILTLTAVICSAALACEEWYDTYMLRITKPAGRSYIYLYDRPSSTKGANLGRIDNGDIAFVYHTENGLGHKSSRWAFCEINGKLGYIRWDNLTPVCW